MKTIGRLQFRHFSETFESRETAYKYLSDIVDATKGDDYRLDESRIGEPILVKYKDENGNIQALLSIGLEGEKDEGVLSPYHIIDSAKLEEEIQSISDSTGDIKHKLEEEIERAIAKDKALQSEIDATQTGAGLEDDGSYIPESTATYVSDATSLKDADTKLDEELARVEKARKDVTGQDTDEYAPNVSLTTRPIAYISDAESLNDADVKLDGAIQNLANETLKNVVVDGVSGVVTENIAVISISADTIPIGPFEEYTGRATTSHPIHNDYSVLEAIKQVNTNSTESIKGVNEKVQTLSKQFETLSDSTDKLSAATVTKFTEIDKKIDDEKTRATAAEESISGTVNTLSSATESAISNVQSELNATQKGAGLESDGSYRTIENANYISEASSLRDADAKLDVALKSESDRATAAENSISGAVTTLSGIVSTFSAKTDGEISRLDTKIETETTRATTAENGLNDRVSTLENVTIIGEKAINVDKSTANENKVITLVIDSDNKVLSQSNNGLKTTLGLNYDSVNKKIQLTGIDGAVLSEFNSSDFVKDGMIDSVVFDPTTKKLTITWNTDAGKESTVIDLTSLTDVYTVAEDSKNYLAINDYVVSAKVGVENGLAKQNDYVALKDRVDLMESGYTTPGSIKHTISDLMITNATEGSNIDAGKSLMRHYAVDGEKYYYASSNAKDMFYGDKVLSTALSDIETSISNLSGSSETIISAITDTINNFSASTVQEFNRISGAVNTEIERATAAENSISGNVNTLSASVVTLSSTTQAIQSELDATQTGAGLNADGTYHKHNTAGDMGNYISNATSLANADMILDGALKSESDRATAAENVISGNVNTLSASVVTLSSTTQAIQSELDATQAGAGLNADGTYHKHNTAGDMGNYISNATSLDEADVLLDVALKNEETRATNAENSISGAVSTFSAATESIIRDLQTQLNEANSTIKTLKTELQTLSGVVETIESKMADNIYSTVKAMLQGTSKQIKVTPDDANEQITIGFADDAIFGENNG